ncbi:MmcQ/YjbR family DNA-binding protein [soil metagenome]
MDLESFQDFCLGLKGVTEEMPFGDTTLVYKVEGKIFALTGIEMFSSINLKCDPEEAIELRERYQAVQPGYHMNKQHWNTILIDHSIPDKLLFEWTKNSYDLVVAKLPKKLREAYMP